MKMDSSEERGREGQEIAPATSPEAVGGLEVDGEVLGEREVGDLASSPPKMQMWPVQKHWGPPRDSTPQGPE